MLSESVPLQGTGQVRVQSSSTAVIDMLTVVSDSLIAACTKQQHGGYRQYRFCCDESSRCLCHHQQLRQIISSVVACVQQ
jgi:hypothetical protein